MRWNGNNVQVGMFVTSTSGEKLGKVIRCDADTFEIEKGLFFPKDYELRYEYITALDGNNITYSLKELQAESRTGEVGRASATAEASKAAAAAAAAATARSARLDKTGSPKTRMALMDEQIGIEKVSRETGHVRVHKVVKTEEKHVTVPVTREDVVIERLAVGRDGAPRTSEAALAEAEFFREASFQEETLDIPLHEEELRVTKRPVVREEVIVHTVLQAGEKEAVATLRHEEAEVEDTRSIPRARSEGYGSPVDPRGYASPGGRR